MASSPAPFQYRCTNGPSAFHPAPRSRYLKDSHPSPRSPSNRHWARFPGQVKGNNLSELHGIWPLQTWTPRETKTCWVPENAKKTKGWWHKLQGTWQSKWLTTTIFGKNKQLIGKDWKFEKPTSSLNLLNYIVESFATKPSLEPTTPNPSQK